MAAARKALVIGLDGATWSVLGPWIDDGTLPNLAALRARGAWGELESTLPPLTPPAWTSFLTGKNPGRHGVFHFALPDEATVDLAAGTPQIVDSRSIDASTLWDILGHHDRRLVTMNLPMSYPPRPVNGVMFTCLLTPPDAPTFTYPPEVAERFPDYRVDLEAFLEDKPFARDAGAEKQKRHVEPSPELVADFQEMEETRARTALELMRSEAWDVFCVVFTAPDRLGHYLWSYHRPEDLDGTPEAEAIHAAIRAFYRSLDTSIGELLDAAGPDVHVVLLSDHGMGPVYRRHAHWNDWLFRRGLVVLEAGSDRSPDAWLLRLRLPRDRIGRLVRRIPGIRSSRFVERARRAPSARVDVERSRAYYVRIFDPVGGIRINATGAGRDELLEQLLREVRDVVDPTTGQPVVRRALRREECFSGPHAESMPDIILVMDEAYGSSDRLSSYSAVVTERPSIGDPGSHRINGVFAIAGPDVPAQAEPAPGVTITDLAPTLLHLLDLPVPEDMDGRVLAELLDPDSLAERPIRHGPPLPRWPSDAEALAATDGWGEDDEELVRERLRQLGYVE